MTKAIRCTYCGDTLYPTMEYVGLPYLQEKTFVGLECDNWVCGAEWDGKGNVIKEGRAV